MGVPPTRSRSSIAYCPKGLKFPISGTLAAIRLKSSMVSGTSASLMKLELYMYLGCTWRVQEDEGLHL